MHGSRREDVNVCLVLKIDSVDQRRKCGDDGGVRQKSNKTEACILPLVRPQCGRDRER